SSIPAARWFSTRSATSKWCFDECAAEKTERADRHGFRRCEERLRPSPRPENFKKAEAARESEEGPRSGHLRGGPARALERERGARRDHPTPLGLAGRDVRARSQPVHPHRG